MVGSALYRTIQRLVIGLHGCLARFHIISLVLLINIPFCAATLSFYAGLEGTGKCRHSGKKSAQYHLNLISMSRLPIALCIALALVAILACNRNARMVLAQSVSGGSAKNGEHLIYTYGCGSCHVIPGVGGRQGMAGPTLRGFASRLYIAGVLQNTPENLVRWIMKPQEVSPGTAMPELGITEARARDIAAYLYTLQ